MAPDDPDPEITSLLDDLGIIDPTPNDLDALAAACRKDASIYEGGPEAAERMAVALRRLAIRMRSQG